MILSAEKHLHRNDYARIFLRDDHPDLRFSWAPARLSCFYLLPLGIIAIILDKKKKRIDDAFKEAEQSLANISDSKRKETNKRPAKRHPAFPRGG